MLLASLLLSLAAVTSSAPGIEDWDRVLPGLELAFPADHGPHPEYLIEWWYITGQVESETGRRFGYQFTIFRRGLVPSERPAGSSALRAQQVYAGHLAVTDVKNGKTLFSERLRRASSALVDAPRGDLQLALEDWSFVRTDGDLLQLSAGDAAQSIGLELQLQPTKPLVLHGANGYSSKGADEGNASAYFSWTRLATSGVLTVGGESMRVAGKSWFDHEYGSSVLETGVQGWDWFGLHLEDGRDLMVFLLRRADGTLSPASSGTLIELDGSSRRLQSTEFSIRSLETWKSPRTEGVYPAKWEIEVPSIQLKVQAMPLVPDCELGTGKSTGVAYWEGPVELRGSHPGRGYAELTGYAGSMDGRF
ncbi:MAG: lipocalin-like domain-containing protein [Planctomycetota bacterium]|nr:lipocalin-like domain-containing protein [Planctomycetota bacterium]